jgi:formyltetrahydrofolate synthetase
MSVKPTSTQTLESTTILVHDGPFVNIVHRHSSILVDQIG